MEVEDLEGRTIVEDEAALDHRLRSVREGDFGAFILWHEGGGESLWVHVNKDVAYMHFFPDNEGKHPGYQPTGMSPAGCDAQVRFLQVGGSQGDAIVMPREALVPVAVAYRAAKEFLNEAALPASITWLEL
jgi:immunity protein Imm1 of predicted polymorphic toxin system